MLIDLDELSYSLADPDKSVLVVSVPAELDHLSAEPLTSVVYRRLPDRDDAALVLDLVDVRLISSIGIAALLQVLESCADRGARVLLASVPAAQRRFLEMLKLDRKFEIADSLDDALAQLASLG